jgi:nitrogen fixation NifU-like protein
MEERKMALEDAIANYAGRLNDPTASASVTGPCGDTMEFYINIEGDKITEIRFYSEGCGVTQSCGAITAFYADQRTLSEAFFVSPGLILKTLGQVPEDHKHCAILASTAFFRALADYLVRP